MNHSINIGFFTAFFVFSLCYAAGVLATDSAIFSNDPRSGSPPTGIRTNTSSNTGLDNSVLLPAEEHSANFSDFSDQKNNSLNDDSANNKFTSIVSAIFILIVVLFLVLIFYLYFLMI